MKTTIDLSTAEIDLSSCERELIHIPGAIQPHGMLFALDDTDLRIAQAGENTLGLLGRGPRELLGRSIEEIVGTKSLELIGDAAAAGAIEDANPIAILIDTLRGTMPFDAILHRTSGEIVLELEPADVTLPATFHRFYHNVRGSVTRFDAARSVQQLCNVGVAEVARLSGFDRVMIYRFDEDWHGEVISEYRASDMEPFLGLHYPASDIPRQARDLFGRSWLRYIADVNYRPAAIVPSESIATHQPLDLSRSVLRSVSPVHIEYLKNMGVGSSLTVSLLKHGVLWGLIACHHRTPKLVPYQLRIACEVIGRTMSLHLSSKEENEDMGHRMSLKSLQVDLLAALSKDADIAHALAAAEPKLLALVGAEGAAIRFGNDCTLVGHTPELRDVLAIVDSLRGTGSDELFVSDSLPGVMPQFESLADTACGIIALPLSRAKGNYVIWFRPEVVATVNWGGDPAKPVESGSAGLRLAPRKSFDRWREIVRLHSLRWNAYEIDAARELRNVIGSIIVERAEELERVNRELERSNVELESFAHVASHDLKEPLRGIHNYASDLIEDYGSVIDETGRKKLETLVRLAQRMDSLIESLLQLSRVGQVDFTGIPTDLGRLIDEVVEIYAPRLQQCGGTIAIATSLPTVLADRVGLREVFNNLFSNAIKYSEGAPHIEIGVDSVRTAPVVATAKCPVLSSSDFVTVFVRDNGIGIREKHLGSIFQMFKRLHPADGYGGGTGAGLAIARKIIERHGGTMWAESGHGAGSTFFLTLPLSR